ncbi:hypothetical protein LCGC14_1618200 [marine sediment metagenome]|uniref:Uncharacterized protein n=1 Tax=marine sediment metagenome TaxID=412755 RepID=A0A0F9L687_9ZZZZ
MKYQVCYNRAAGEANIIKWSDEEWENCEESGVRNQYGHSNVVAECDTQPEADKQFEALKGDPVYAVFVNYSAGEVFMSVEDGLTGNWRGSKYGYSSLVGEHDSRDGAEEEVFSWEKHFGALS